MRASHSPLTHVVPPTVLELSDLACLEAALHTRDPAAVGDDARASATGSASPSRGKLRPGKELIILLDEVNQDAGHHDGQGASLSSSSSVSSSEKAPAIANSARKPRPNSSADRRPGTEATTSPTVVSTGSDGTKAFAGMSMMERQAEWLKKKQDKVEVERLRQEEEKEKELTFQPKIIRRVTYAEGGKPSKDSSGSAAPPRPLKRGESYGNLRKLDATASGGTATVATADPKEKSIPKPPRPAGQKSKRRKSQSHNQQSQAGASVSQPIEISSSLLESMKSELEASKAARRQSNATEDEGDNDDNESDEDEQCAADNNEDGTAAAGTESNATGGPTAALSDPSAPMKSWSDRPTIGGRRVDFDSGDTKARLVLQDASRFDLTSMYRKTDKKAGRDGVALHMGRRENTFEEEVIAVLFDKEKVSELEAARWWLDHEHRFAEFMRGPVPVDPKQ